MIASKYWALLGVALCGLGLAACSEESGVLPPFPQTGSGGAAIDCREIRTSVDQLLDQGRWPVVTGTIRSVSPVLDSFSYTEEGEQTCRHLEYAEPAIRIVIALDKASWDSAEAGGELTLALDSSAFLAFEVSPSLSASGKLGWTDGRSYLPVGARVAAVGGLLETGELYTRAVNLMGVHEDNTLFGYQPGQCVGGTLNDRDVFEVIAQAAAGSDGSAPKMEGSPAVSTRCNG